MLLELSYKEIMRVGIFSFFDKDGIVDRYVEFLLFELKANIDYLYIVVNGKVNNQGKEIFARYADYIYIRCNIGYDSGAYKDVIFNIAGIDKIKEYDELVLCNDTFYGPFVPFREIFDTMQDPKVQFWGLRMMKNSFLSHIQTFFIVFRKKILTDKRFYDFWDKNILYNEQNISYIYAWFERNLFYFLVQCGYTFGEYAKSKNFDIYRNGNLAITEEKLPILKKKVFSERYFQKENCIDALQSIPDFYDISMILDNVKREYNISYKLDDIRKKIISKSQLDKYVIPQMNVTEKDVLDFMIKNEKIYIYGIGMVATCIAYIFEDDMDKVYGYLITSGLGDDGNVFYGKPVITPEKLSCTDSIGIIVALNKENSASIKHIISEYKNVLYLW